MKSTQQKTPCDPVRECRHQGHHSSCRHESGAIYGLGVIGALFYFLQNATTFWAVLLGIAKAVFWPAFVVFRLLTLLQI